jgi:hypothetical protein
MNTQSHRPKRAHLFRTSLDLISAKRQPRSLCPIRPPARSTRNLPHDNEERFSLGGAACRPRRGVSAAEIRAGEQKTDWTKPLPPPPWLWALNAGGAFAGAVSGHSGRPSTRGRGPLGAIRRGNRAFERLSSSGFGRLTAVRGPRWLSLHKRPHPDLADNPAACSWNADSAS